MSPLRNTVRFIDDKTREQTQLAKLDKTSQNPRHTGQFVWRQKFVVLRKVESILGAIVPLRKCVSGYGVRSASALTR
jgi:hypothetical protein